MTCPSRDAWECCIAVNNAPVNRNASYWMSKKNTKHTLSFKWFFEFQNHLTEVNLAWTPTRGYFLGDEKPVDSWTVLYHHEAHTPSSGMGPASHLQENTMIQDYG